MWGLDEAGRPLLNQIGNREIYSERENEQTPGNSWNGSIGPQERP